MRPRRLVPLLALTAAGLASFGCAEQSAAVRVGDRTVSEADLIDELDAFADNETLFAAGGQSADSLRGELAGSYSQEFVAEILQQRITFMLAEQVFEDEGLELTDVDRQQAEQGLDTQLNGGLGDFPDGYRQGFVDDVARYNLLAGQLGPDEFDAALVAVADDSEISVSSRFGEWDEDQFVVVPPAGPTPVGGTGVDPLAPSGGDAG